MGWDDLGVWSEGTVTTALSAQSVPSLRERPSCSSKHKSCSDYHWQMVEGYRLWRLTWEQERDRVTAEYDSERRLYNDANVAPTFKAWLIGQRGHNRNEE